MTASMLAAAFPAPSLAASHHIDPRLADEPARLAALHRYDVLDTPSEAPFEKIVTLVKNLLRVPIVAIPLVDERRQWFKAQHGLDCPETPRAAAFCNHTIRSRAPLEVSDARTDPRFANSPLVLGPPFIRAYLGVPLTTPDGYNVGALCAIDTVPRTFTPYEAATLATFAQLTQDFLEMRQPTTQDQLTGTLTRRAFSVELSQAVQRFLNAGEPASLVVLDLDRFGSVNEELGYSGADDVLRAVAASCKATLAASDRFGRLGGQLFGALLAGANQHSALAAAQRMREAIAATPTREPLPHPVTASVGIATLKRAIVSVEAWRASADGALEAAKRAGPDCCRVAGWHDTGQPPH